jgi:hypothetical protein
MFKQIAKYLWVLPVIFMACFIMHYSVNTPFQDDWSNVPIYQKIDNGDVPAELLWHQHNEHRIFVPNTLEIAVAYVSHGNLKVQMFVSLALAVGTLLVLFSALKSYSLLLALWLFSPIQAENWLWGFEIAWFLCILAVVWSLKLLTEKRLKAAIAGAVVASFSTAIGLFVWPVGFVLLLLSKQPKKWWIVSGVITYIVYFIDYTRPSSTGGSLHFIGFGRYFLGLLGGTVTTSPEAAVLAGSILLSLLVPLGYLVYRNKFRKGHFWMGLILFALTAMAFTDIGRNASGVVQALSSRYTAFTLLYIIGAIGLCWTLAKHAGVRWLVVGLSVPLLISSYLSGLDNARLLHQTRVTMKACTHIAQPTKDCLKLTDFFDPLPITQHRLDYLKAKHWSGY